MTEFISSSSSSPSKQRKPLVFWRRKEKSPRTTFEDAPSRIPAFEHPCSPRCHSSSFTTLSTMHESDASFLTFHADEEEEDNHNSRPSPSTTVTMSPCRSPFSPRHRMTRSHRNHHPALHSIPPPSVVEHMMQEHPTTNPTTSSSQDSSEHVAEELQEQELLALALELSLREAQPSTLSDPLREDRLQRELFERVLEASRTDL